MYAFVKKLSSLTEPASGPAPLDYPFAESDVARLHQIAGCAGNGEGGNAASIDDGTWQGMLMPAYFERLAAGASIFGKQQLYRDLRGGVGDGARDALTARLALLQEDPRIELLDAVARPLRDADCEIASLLFEEGLASAPRWAGKCWLLMVGLAVSVAAVAFSPLAWLGALFFLFQMVAVQARYHAVIESWNRKRVSVQMMLRTCSLGAAASHPALAPFAATGADAGRINRALQPSAMQALSMVGAYLDWFLQANVEHYFRSVRLVARERAFLQRCFHLCAQFDADLALARQRADFETCQARRGAGLRFDAAVHPLIEAPDPLSIDVVNGAFVSGQNGVGKSTLLRTVGLNLLTARAFGFCYARAALCPMLPVVASMQSEDSLLGGASLYVAELTRARELLEAAARERCVFIIDEIFRGTNHLESVSSAAAVLDELADGNLVLVSSHNLVLAGLLGHRLDALCVSRDANGTLALAPGVLADTNGISLLAQHGFSAQVDAKARRVFAWLEGFMAQPAGAGDVLSAPTPARAA
ncbi:MAG: hypothetical protein JWP59_2111 [Massilia sp.]|nr:hypothetical protein [Massilia sp.]